MANNYSKKSAYLLFSLVFALAFSAKAQLAVQTNLTPQQLVQNILTGQGVTVSNITYTGEAEQIGSFTGGQNAVGISSGLIMSSGDVTAAPLPEPTFSTAGEYGNPGDTDLDVLSPTNPSIDAAVLELDFIPAEDTLVFRYVFASEEYPDFTDPTSAYNDIFAFFISNGPGYNQPTNVALIPSTTIPVSVTTVNDNSYSQYYNDNFGAANLCYGGYTTVFTARAIVVPCSTYHFKFAIADRGDETYASSVFLEAGSFSAVGSFNLSSSNAGSGTGSANDTILVEGCSAGTTINITRIANFGQTIVVPLSYAGQATMGTDYDALPDSITFLPGDTTIQIPITALVDGTTEGIETLIIQITDPTLPPCIGQSVTQTITFYITEPSPLQATAGSLTNVINDCVPVTINASYTGGSGTATYTWLGQNGLGTSPSITVNPPQTTTYSVIITDACPTIPADTAQVTITVIKDTITSSVNIGDTTIYCGSPLTLVASANGGNGVYLYTWSTGDTTATINVTPISATTYTLNITDTCGAYSEEIVVQVTVECDIIAPNVFTPNGDNNNDVLVFSNLEAYPNSTLTIFNRWGRKIYASADYKNNWDGENLPEGVYYFVLNIKNKDKELKGTITILR